MDMAVAAVVDEGEGQGQGRGDQGEEEGRLTHGSDEGFGDGGKIHGGHDPPFGREGQWLRARRLAAGASPKGATLP
jgi:hypothetical protein